jgi:hypothetical protein
VLTFEHGFGKKQGKKRVRAKNVTWELFSLRSTLFPSGYLLLLAGGAAAIFLEGNWKGRVSRTLFPPSLICVLANHCCHKSTTADNAGPQQPPTGRTRHKFNLSPPFRTEMDLSQNLSVKRQQSEVMLY